MRTVPLHGRLAGGRTALVDDADHDRVSRYRLRAREANSGRLTRTYAVTDITVNGWTRTTVSLHQLLTGWDETDHINGDGLDCRRHNLRPARGLNSANRRKAPGWSSRYKGVSWAGGCWRASIGTDGRSIHLGLYDSETAAARAYDDAAQLLWGEYACLNMVPVLGRHRVLTLF